MNVKRATNFLKKHPTYVSTIHAIGGIGVGILIARPIAGAHPVRFAVAFLILSLLGHVYALFQ